MGWTVTLGSSLKEMIRELTEPQSWTVNGGIARLECIAKTVRLSNPGNGRMWVVYEKSLPDGTTHRFIVEFLMAYFRREEGWGYKDIDEDMGPVDVDCPLKYLGMVDPPTNDYSREWRDRVREHHGVRPQLSGNLSSFW